ncbi:hypothetical protein BC938DRAFT_483105 [Jimgerdemannia flammicorona]|uniref:AAA-ATPase-like domain-containing protein n=1 Tax=Jimgerdemannia flammicorona TaxID=994334 RepID=A0A433QVY2_9FUNG|nr:hypothetical protein BC938DRAFT_483105 [Jimgerdemannia flammicorona]
MSNELRRSLDDEQGPNQQASGKGMYVDEGGFRVYSISTELNDDSSSHKTRQMTNQEISMTFSDQSPLTRREPKRLPRQVFPDGHDATLLPGDKVLIESSDFQQMVNARVSLVDKSMLIAEFVDCHSEVSLVLRPRHFGKSTNLSMLRLFFECIEGETESKKRSRMELFNQFEVMKERPDLFSKEFGKYPVIFLALKDINGTTWNDMMTQMRKVISEIYREHGYLTQGLEDYEKPEFNSIIDMESASWDLSFALTNLSGYLADYHGSDCIVLIDDYDTPLRVAYNKGYYKEARDFFQNMFSSLLKDNSNLSKAFIVSVLPKAKSDFLGPNNISVYSMETSWYADMFGFTEHEVGLLFDRHKVNIPIADPQCQHNGYESGDYHQRYKLYNPWSILCLCADKELIRFRDKTTIKHLLFNAGSAFMSDVLRLLTIKNAENNADYNSITINDHRHIWALLLYAGYLTLNDEGQLTIPNDKVYMEWVNWIMPMLSSASLNSRLDELLSGETKYLEDMIVISLSDLDVGSEHSGIKAEAFFHGLYLGMLSHLRYKYDIHLNGDAESGRYDIRVLPKSAAQLAILMYLKVAHGKDSTNSAARNELDKVEANGYDVGIPSHVKKLLVFDILFDGNHTHVVVKKLRQNVSHEGKLEWCDGE